MPSRTPAWTSFRIILRASEGSACTIDHLTNDIDPSCRYCTRLQAPSFWGGEVEILILSKMLKSPIYVFQKAEEAGRSVSSACDHEEINRRSLLASIMSAADCYLFGMT